MICEYCGKEFIPNSSRKQKYCSRKCQRTGSVKSRRQALKRMSLEYKGSKCEICGYDKCLQALEFHHLDPNEKDFGIAEKGHTRSWKSVKKELDKCILVCSNCHMEIHYNITIPE
jgi:hypothetical protein